MTAYRRRSDRVEATQLTDSNAEEVAAYCNGTVNEDGTIDAMLSGDLWRIDIGWYVFHDGSAAYDRRSFEQAFVESDGTPSITDRIEDIERRLALVEQS